ncbi:T57 [Tupaiid betaherpesvirus 1]|uniref:Major DNA-binding protein n=2 Tax=Betaherpesvirinae TaxID=10357 RepID=DNBI_TUHV2|nr:T57 [Tupaiid betaherpesvirus 1]Q9WRL7.1 RecName: Full=Major DNA-binding protein [Tupaiid herpesvirus 2]AAD42933.1 major DNA binding protein [Tupaiid betaherpesvirus 1]AAK57106.1 T57 [Tupaiid betaherpesvirus 1]
MEDDLNTLAPLGPAAWLFVCPRQDEWCDVLAALSLCDRSSSVAIAPLLVDLTVDRDFQVAVRTPISRYEGGVLTKVTSMWPAAFVFHNAEAIVSRTEDHGDVGGLCAEARARFGVASYRAEAERADTDFTELWAALGVDGARVVMYAVVGYGLKELLYAGQLVPCVEEARTVLLGAVEAFKLPLYPATLFADGDATADGAAAVGLRSRTPFVDRRGLYVSALSEALFYYVFTALGQALRFGHTEHLIDEGMKQFLQDTQNSVKLAPQKRYYGYLSQKLTPGERDQLLLCDAIACELAFSFASVYFDSAYEPAPLMNYSEWPLVRAAEGHADLLRRLSELKLHLSAHVGALVFSGNSVLYQTRIAFFSAANKVPAGGTAQDGLLKAVQFCNGLTCLTEDALNDACRTVKFEGPGGGGGGRDEQFTPQHLAWACATSPHLMSDLVWYLNRLAIYNTGQNGGSALYEHLVHCAVNLCPACRGRCCQSCYQTAFVRIQTRLPPLPKQLKREPFVLTLFSRFLCDVDVLGTFGKRYAGDAKEPSAASLAAAPGEARKVGDEAGLGAGGGGPGGRLGVNVDRLKYFNQILDYCKRNSLIDPSTGEDTLAVRGRADFMSALSGLNRCVDEAAMALVSEVRMKSNRDEVAGATQAFNLDLNPYAVAFSPLLAHQYYRAFFLIVQNLALVSASSYVVDNPLTVSSLSRWLLQHFQSICGAFASNSARKGLLFTKDAKCSKSVEFERFMDFALYAASGRHVLLSTETKLCKLSVCMLRTCRVKNRPIPRGGKGLPVSVFFKRDVVQRRNPVRGCLAFLLYAFHERLFPGCGLSCLDFWQKVYHNALPKSVAIGKMEEFNAFVKYVLNVTTEYNEHDLIDVPPSNLLSYVEYRFHNKFLCFYGFGDYLSTLHGLSTKLVPQNHLNFPHLLAASPKFASVAEYVLYFKKLKLDGVPPPHVATFSRESLVRSVFENRSLVTVAFGIEKYSTSGGSREVFHFGQIGYFAGNGVERSLNVNSMGGGDYRYMRQRFVLATRLVDLLLRRSRRETVLFDADLLRTRVLAALESHDTQLDPELAAIAEIMDGRGGEPPEYEDVLFFVDGQECLAASIVGKIKELIKKGVEDFSLTALGADAGAGGGPAGSAGGPESGGGAGAAGGEGTYDLSALFLDVENECVVLEGPTAAALDGGGDGDECAFPAKRLRL